MIKRIGRHGRRPQDLLARPGPRRCGRRRWRAGGPTSPCSAGRRPEDRLRANALAGTATGPTAGPGPAAGCSRRRSRGRALRSAWRSASLALLAQVDDVVLDRRLAVVGESGHGGRDDAGARRRRSPPIRDPGHPRALERRESRAGPGIRSRPTASGAHVPRSRGKSTSDRAPGSEQPAGAPAVARVERRDVGANHPRDLALVGVEARRLGLPATRPGGLAVPTRGDGWPGGWSWWRRSPTSWWSSAGAGEAGGTRPGPAAVVAPVVA